MNAGNLASELELKKVTDTGMRKEIRNVYIGDLLSVVMGKCPAGSAWITSQTHVNILSVADLNDVACIILAGGTAIDRNLKEKASEAGVALLSTDKEAYELAWRIHEVLA